MPNNVDNLLPRSISAGSGIIWAVLDIGLVANVLETIASNGESHWAGRLLLVTLFSLSVHCHNLSRSMTLAVATILSILILCCGDLSYGITYSLILALSLLCARQSRFLRPPAISSFFVISSLGTLLVTFGIATNEWHYCRLAGEVCTSAAWVPWLHVAAVTIVFFATWKRCASTLAETILARAIASILFCSWAFGSISNEQGIYSWSYVSDSLMIGPYALLILRALACLTCKNVSHNVSFSFVRVGLCTLSITMLVALFISSAICLQDEQTRIASQSYELSPSFLLPVLVAEDPLFFDHHGVDFVRLRNAVQETFELGRYGRGGSTITMQLAKVEYLNYDKTLLRKLRQIILAILMELAYTKSQIFYAYLEKVPFGLNVVGLRSAAKKYFDSRPDALTPADCLSLVLSIYDPETYNPAVTPVPKEVNFRAVTIKGRLKVFSQRLREEVDASGILVGKTL